jgi:hypothetical protein
VRELLVATQPHLEVNLLHLPRVDSFRHLMHRHVAILPAVQKFRSHPAAQFFLGNLTCFAIFQSGTTLAGIYKFYEDAFPQLDNSKHLQ